MLPSLYPNSTNYLTILAFPKQLRVLHDQIQHGICVIVGVCESDKTESRIDTFWGDEVFNRDGLENDYADALQVSRLSNVTLTLP
jgi:hypothetical protein